MKHSLIFWSVTVLVILVLLFFFVVMPILTVKIYDSNFDRRYETSNIVQNKIAFYPGLEGEPCSFKTKQGHTLASMKYYKKGQEVKGIVVIAHGLGGGGHKGFTDVADRFTSDGYLVFGYDATANDLSEGDKVGGLPQGVIDLDYALRYVKEQPEYEGLPIVLFGYSWGSYSTGNVLNLHPDVKAAVMVSGFNESPDMIEQRGIEYAGKFAAGLMLPYVRTYERIRFGEHASLSAVKGFETAKDTRVMIVYSMDDDTVHREGGYDPFLPYMDDPRFTFKIYEDRGHQWIFRAKPNTLTLDDALFDEITAMYDACCKGE
ncbi:MAG: alpha/beta hydrolase [Oscillospiraceae bacterium]|nr:alpha/beta hydrolase [Oscillospiraceae bacterium]